MKIIKPPETENPALIAYQNAIRECDKCPFCGYESESMGLLPDKYRTYGFFLEKTYTRSKFKCNHCKSEFASDPYDEEYYINEIATFINAIILIVSVMSLIISCVFWSAEERIRLGLIIPGICGVIISILYYVISCKLCAKANSILYFKPYNINIPYDKTGCKAFDYYLSKSDKRS